MVVTDVVYDGFSFVNAGCVITNLDQYRIAQRDNQLDARANRNGAVLSQSFYGHSGKSILVEGYYDGPDTNTAQTMYDTIAQALNRQDRRLDLPHAGGTRYYTATPQNEIISNPNGLNRITFSIEFVVPDASAYELSPTTLISTTITSASATIPLTVGGSVVARPAITLTYSGVTGGTSKTMALRNAKDFVGLTFNRTFANGDQILIDSANFQLYINGVLTDPTGRFPTWEAGAGSLYYTDSLTTRSVTISATYIKRNK